MGISGLLPALKPIQKTRHLSQFAGKTIAIDAYVWLHKGIYTCPTELATGKPTHKYVDYAMHRVRLLRYHNVEPYVVFDGGPLPAKQGTERDRKQRRDEHLARGNALAAQGKHKEAREPYVKCIDVTPQMAYQLIKALRTENVSYVVAPYEADAQLAYLERIGLVDAILTEDSDLLVYGCTTVLFKLDTVAATVVSVSRKDFGSVTAPSSEISLLGWSDTQFRAMAILSGCDYLPSIPGIGLKTACSLLRKWKTVEQVVRVLMLEGKKSVPRDYLKNFQKAEKCFLHQRVYCPLSERLVHLIDTDQEKWSDEYDAYVGRPMDPITAKQVASGNIDPIDMLPMKDINPSYAPLPLKPSARATHLRPHNGKGKARELGEITRSAGGLLNYFGSNALVTTHSITNPKTPTTLDPAIVPRAMCKGSGKRTLAEVTEQDIALRNPRNRTMISPPSPCTQSKFFSTAGDKKRHRTLPSADLPNSMDKENAAGSHVMTSHPEKTIELDIDDEVISDLSHRADHGGETMDLDEGNEENVRQEEGYISPFEAGCDSEIEAPDLSSPVRPPKKRKGSPPNRPLTSKELEPVDDDFGAEALSSPPPVSKRWTTSNIFKQWEYRGDRKPDTTAAGLSRQRSFPLSSCLSKEDVKRSDGHTDETTNSSRPMKSKRDPFGNETTGQDPKFLGPDLFLDDITEVGSEASERLADITNYDSSLDSACSAYPHTPADDKGGTSLIVIDVCDHDTEILGEEGVILTDQARTQAVMEGWKARWARQPPCSQLTPTPKSLGKAPHSRAGISEKAFQLPGHESHKMCSGTSNLKRSTTNITPRGRHSLNTVRPQAWRMQFGRDALETPCIDLTSVDDK